MKLCHIKDRNTQIHAVKEELWPTIQITHCGWQVRSLLPHVSVECWGNADMEWCPDCSRAVAAEKRRQSIVQPPRQKVRDRRIEVDRRQEIAEYRASHSLSETAEKFGIHRITVVAICNQMKAGVT